jgi:Domain of unknown function (DUF5658)
MVHETDRDGESAADPSGAAAVDGARRRRRRPLPRSYWPLLILFVGLQVADVVTTTYALAVPGNWEANPIMASYQAQWGAAWWLPKAAMVGWICIAAPMTRRWWPMVFAVSYSFVIVAGNLAIL